MARNWGTTASEHGESVYRPEIRVPLLIVMPSGPRSPGVVRETVSLRDLPATIVDPVDLADGAPFPGRSLARFWFDPATAAVTSAGAVIPGTAQIAARICCQGFRPGFRRRSSRIPLELGSKALAWGGCRRGGC